MFLREYLRKAYIIYRSQGLNSLLRSTYIRVVANKFTYRLKSIIRYQIQRTKYNAPAHPLQVIYVNPNEINYTNDSVCQICGLGQIKSGHWDKNKSSWRDSWRYRGLKERFVKGYEWEDTIYYKKHKKKIEQEGYVDDIRSTEEFLKYRCKYLDNLYKEMKKNGYKMANRHNDNKGTRLQKVRRKTWKDHLEPFASITRTGEIHVNEGTHRRSIAEFAGIKKIPLHVLVRHKEWQKIRDSIDSYESDIPPSFREYLCHPDIEDIISE